MYSTLLMLGLLIGRSASAAEYAVEIGQFERREQADAVAVGAQAPVVLRRYVDGVGWRYIVVVEGLENLDAANSAATAARKAGHSAEILELGEGAGGARPSPAAAQQPPPAPAAPPPVAAAPTAAAPTDVLLPDANTVLAASAKAHGGRRGLGAPLQAAAAVELVVLRTVTTKAGALAFRSRYLRQGDARRVEVQAVSGPGVDSVTVVPELGLPAMSVAGVQTPIDPARARQSAELFAPEAVFGGVLALPAELANWSSTDGVVTVSAGIGSERTELILSRSGPAGAALAEGVTRASFGVNDNLTRSITWATPEGDVTWRFDRYQKVGEVNVPHSILILRDGREVERVEVERLDLAPAVGAGELLVPAPGG